MRQEGRAVRDALGEELPALVGGISFRKSMRCCGDAAYSRPMRWILALHGGAVVSFEYAGLAAGAGTRVLRTAAQPEEEVPSADDYARVLRAARITLGLAQRREDVWLGVQAAAQGARGAIPDACRGDLLTEVCNLVESPTVVLGSFDPGFLALPREVLVMVMRKHQRYFPVVGPGGALLPHFATPPT